MCVCVLVHIETEGTSGMEIKVSDATFLVYDSIMPVQFLNIDQQPIVSPFINK